MLAHPCALTLSIYIASKLSSTVVFLGLHMKTHRCAHGAEGRAEQLRSCARAFKQSTNVCPCHRADLTLLPITVWVWSSNPCGYERSS